jgi:ADP-ribosylglycohydrolase
MLGAIIGDIAGSRFEGYHHNIHTKEFTFFHECCHLTDDSVMTLAVAEAILQCEGDYSKLAARATSGMQSWGRRYPHVGYGKSFKAWIFNDKPEPYHSYGNGSAMRVSPCAYAADSLEEALQLCDTVTKITHDHEEGMKGSRAITAAIYLARQGKTQAEIKAYVKEHYYTFNPHIDSADYQGGCSCQVTVPLALQAYFDAAGYEDAIRGAIALGGDSDTIACMAGGIAAATFGIPRSMRKQALAYFFDDELSVLQAFEAKFGAAKETTGA